MDGPCDSLCLSLCLYIYISLSAIRVCDWKAMFTEAKKAGKYTLMIRAVGTVFASLPDMRLLWTVKVFN